MIRLFKKISFSCLSLQFLFNFPYPLHSQDYTFTQIGIYYYDYLEKDEFFNFILPQEKFLLNLIENISTEIHERGIKGELGEGIGIDEIMPREEMVMDNYEEEINKIANLFEEIEFLERKARQKVNLDILKMLSDLRGKVKKILEQSRIPVNNQTDSVKNDISPNKENPQRVISSRIDRVEKNNPEFLNSWKYDRIFNYKLNLMKYKLLRNRLLKNSSSKQKERMFRRYLHKALKNYENGEFRLTRLQFKDIIDTYKEYYLDDVLFYYGESCFGLNYLDEAASCYVTLFKEYPESSYLQKSFIKLIYIYYIYNNFDKMSAVYQNIKQIESSIDKTNFSEVSYLMGYAFYQKGDYRKAIDVLKNVSKKETYYYPSLYLAATCCSNIERIDLTISLYQKICNEISAETKDPISLQIKNNAILKLGLIYFDQGKTELSENYFNLIPEDFSHYDLSLLGKAWSAYKSGNPIKTLENTQQLIQGSMLSQYSHEARLLAAYSKNILGRTEEAVEDLKTVYQIEKTPSNNELLQKSKEKFDESSNRQTETDKLLTRLNNIGNFLYSTLNKSLGLEQVYKQLGLKSNVNLREQISILDTLEQKANSLRDENLKDRIRLLRSNLLNVYDEQSESSSIKLSKISLITDNASNEEYLEYYFSSLLTRILQEKEEIKEFINEIKNRIELAKAKDNFMTVNRAEIRLSEIYTYYNTINQYEVWLRENFPEQFKVNLDQWAYYSGYGISDINFARIRQLDSNINDISYTIDVLDDVYNKKEINLKKQVEGLLSDVSKLEEQIQKESVKKQLEKREKFFNNQYFDKQLQESIIGEIEENIGKVKKNEKE